MCEEKEQFFKNLVKTCYAGMQLIDSYTAAESLRLGPTADVPTDPYVKFSILVILCRVYLRPAVLRLYWPDDAV